MELQFVIENKIKWGNLPKPINKMVDEEFNLIISKEKWNIVVILSNLAFWDERRRIFDRKCKQKALPPNTFLDEAIIDLISNTLIPYY